jgi:predicted nuclease with TOPRIM domain
MPDDIPVLSSQLQEMQNELKDFFMKELSKLTKEVHANNHTVESVNKRVSTLTTRLEQLERNPPKNDGTKDEEDSFDDTDHPEDIV